jgi:hypothetical protein
MTICHHQNTMSETQNASQQQDEASLALSKTTITAKEANIDASFVSNTKKKLTAEAYKFLFDIAHVRQRPSVAIHNAIPLAEFRQIFPSPKLLPLACSLLQNGDNRLKLHFCIGGRNEKEDSDHERFLGVVEAYFYLHFESDRDQRNISRCMASANILAITCKNDSDSNQTEIICAMNFSFLAKTTIFVNWLATSFNGMQQNHFGETFMLESGGGNWQHRHLATFLLHISQLCAKIGYHEDALSTRPLQKSKKILQVPIILQARMDENPSYKYYIHLGFQVKGNINSDSELDENLKSLAMHIRLQSMTKFNFVHFLYDALLDTMMKDDGDMLECLKLSTTREQYLPLSCTDELQNEFRLCRFPFHILKEHLMILSSDCDLLHFPFNVPDSELNHFLLPSNICAADECIEISHDDQESTKIPEYLQGQGAQSGWLENGIIDFFAMW